MKYCIVAGGCFWCMSKPYYEYDGIKTVYSGYGGGTEINPTYEDVKAQRTSHKECIKLIYDDSIISYKDILDIYFQTIDPFDDGGQFIDRGDSYAPCIFYQNAEMLQFIQAYIKDLEAHYGRRVMVKVEPETTFYMAEEYHQDFAIKNPDLMEEELIASGRKVIDG